MGDEEIRRQTDIYILRNDIQEQGDNLAQSNFTEYFYAGFHA